MKWTKQPEGILLQRSFLFGITGIVLGTLFYGLMYQLTGNIRMSVVSIALFFALGYILLWLVPKKETAAIQNDYIDNE
jgi:MFS-type transporter involved in bile tolerance (Atg22 family)